MDLTGESLVVPKKKKAKKKTATSSSKEEKATKKAASSSSFSHPIDRDEREDEEEDIFAAPLDANDGTNKIRSTNEEESKVVEENIQEVRGEPVLLSVNPEQPAPLSISVPSKPLVPNSSPLEQHSPLFSAGLLQKEVEEEDKVEERKRTQKDKPNNEMETREENTSNPTQTTPTPKTLSEASQLSSLEKSPEAPVVDIEVEVKKETKFPSGEENTDPQPLKSDKNTLVGDPAGSTTSHLSSQPKSSPLNSSFVAPKRSTHPLMGLNSSIIGDQPSSGNNGHGSPLPKRSGIVKQRSAIQVASGPLDDSLLSSPLFDFLKANAPSSAHGEDAKLVQYIVNNLVLGQWEVARACIKVLFTTNKHSAEVLLKALIMSPSLVATVRSASVTSPYQLAWLCFLEFQELFPELVDENFSPTFLSYLEFSVLSAQLFTESSQAEDLRAFLYNSFMFPSNETMMKPALKESIFDLAFDSPLNTSHLCNILASNTNPSLRADILSCQLRVITEAIPKPASWVLLQNLQLTEGDLARIDLKPLFQKLLQYIVEGKTEGQTYSPQRLFYVYCSLLAVDYSRLPILLNSFLNAEKTLFETPFRGYDEVFECLKAPLSFWPDFFLYSTTSSEHPLAAVFETGLYFVRNARFDDLKLLFQPDLFAPLRSVMFLLGWNLCQQNFLSSKQLMTSLIQNKLFLLQSNAFDRAVRVCLYFIEFVDWSRPSLAHLSKFRRGSSLDMTSSLVPAEIETSEELIAGAQNSLLSEIVDEQIKNPHFSMLPILSRHLDLENISVPSLLQQLQARPVDDANGLSSLTYEFDILLYHAFSALKLCTKSIILSSQLQDSQNQTSFGGSHSGSRAAGQPSQLAFNLRDMERQRDTITLMLGQVRDSLQSISVVPYRLELLENLYSLLFLSTEELSPLSPNTPQNFICSEFAVGAILELVQQEIDAFPADLASKLGELYASPLVPMLPCAIPEKDFEARFSKLKDAIQEARWRLHFIQKSPALLTQAPNGTPLTCVQRLFASPATLLVSCLRVKDFERALIIVQEYKLGEESSKSVKLTSQLHEISLSLARKTDFSTIEEILKQVNLEESVHICLDLAVSASVTTKDCAALLQKGAGFIQQRQKNRSDSGTGSRGLVLQGPDAYDYLSQQMTTWMKLTNSPLSVSFNNQEYFLDEERTRLRVELTQKLKEAYQSLQSGITQLELVTAAARLENPNSSSGVITALNNTSKKNRDLLRAGMKTVEAICSEISRVRPLAQWNYITHLFRHLEILAQLVLSQNASLGNLKEEDSSPHRFARLTESPVSTFAHLIFDEGMSEASAQKIAEQLHLDLTQILIRSSCPRVEFYSRYQEVLRSAQTQADSEPKRYYLPASPSKPSSVSSPDPTSSSQQPQLLLNEEKMSMTDSKEVVSVEVQVESVAMTKSRLALNRFVSDASPQRQTSESTDSPQPRQAPTKQSPTMLSYELLRSLIQACEGFAAVEDGPNAAHRTVVAFSPRICADILASPEFAAVRCRTQDLVNVELALLSETEKLCFFANVVNIMRLHATIELGPPACVLDAVEWAQNVFYELGPLGVISLFNLEHTYLRASMTPPELLNTAFHLFVSALPFDDPLNSYKVKIAEPCLVYVLWNGAASSPPPTPLLHSAFQTTLRNARTKYLTRHVRIDNTNKTFSLPSLLDWYRRDILNAPYGDSDLVAYVASNLPAGTPAYSFVCKSTASSMRLDKFSWAPICEFESSTSGSEPLPIQGSSLTPEEAESLLDAHFRSSMASYQKPKYNLNTKIVAFLTERSPVVAALGLLATPYSLNSSGAKPAPSATKSNHSDLSQHQPQTAFSRNVSRPVPGVETSTNLPSSFSAITPVSAPTESFSHDSPVGEYMQTVYGNFASLNPSLKKFLDIRLARLLSFQTIAGKRLNTDEILSFVLDAGSRDRKMVAAALVNEVVMEKNYINALHLLDSNLFLSGVSLDFLLSAIVRGKGCDKQSAWRYINRISDKVLAARLTLEYHLNWDVDICVDMLSVKLMHVHEELSSRSVSTNKSDAMLPQEATMSEFEPVSSPDPSNTTSSSSSTPIHQHDFRTWSEDKMGQLEASLSDRLNKIRIYAQILKLSSPSIPHGFSKSFSSASSYLPSSVSNSQKSAWNSWQEIEADTVSQPKKVVSYLIEKQQFALARKWAQLHQRAESEIDENYLLMLLDNDETLEAHQVLESMPNAEQAISICRYLIRSLRELRQVKFIIHYMLDKFKDTLSAEEIRTLKDQDMGARILWVIPDKLRPYFRRILHKPRSSVEQLLMNKNVELCGQILRQLSREEQLSLLVLETASSSSSSSSTLGSKPVFEQGRGGFQPVNPVRGRSQPSLPNKRGSTVSMNSFSVQAQPEFQHDLISFYADKAMEFIGWSNKAPKDDFGGSGLFKGAARDLDSRQKLIDAPSCFVCHEEFSLFKKRSRCRICDRAVCSSCASLSIPHPEYDFKVRACKECYKQHSVSRHIASALDTSHEGIDGVSHQNVKKDEAYEAASRAELDAEQAGCTWQVELDETKQSKMRECFFFEEAPSTTLCLSILELYVSPERCGNACLFLCEKLSSMLARNPETLDHSLIVSSIKRLLFTAKMKFYECGRTAKMDLCVTYLGIAELFGLLVSSRCQGVASLHDMTDLAKTKRVRDLLIEADRFDLAMQVATKCNLETFDVWSAWGVSKLAAGLYDDAREKLQKCFQLTERGKLSPRDTRLLTRIIETLELSVCPSVDDVSFMYDRLSTLMKQEQRAREMGVGQHAVALLPDSSPKVAVSAGNYGRVSMVSCLNAERFREAQHYLTAYASPETILTFYMKHGFLNLALQYILDQNTAPKLFVELIFLVCLHECRLDDLEAMMRQLDPSLSKWLPSLAAVTHHLKKSGLFSLVFRVQVFMEDHFGAALTCVRFATTPNIAVSERLLQYQNAKDLFLKGNEEQTKAKRNPSTPSPSMGQGGPETYRVELPRAKYVEYMESVSFQLAVITLCETEIKKAFDPKAMEECMNRSLFDEASRPAICVELLVSCRSVLDCYPLVYKIIQNYKLDAVSLYKSSIAKFGTSQQLGKMDELLKAIGKSVTDEEWDAIARACVDVLFALNAEKTLINQFVVYMKAEENKINAQIACGELKLAYLAAVKTKNIDAVLRIRDVAESTRNDTMLSICEKYLKTAK